MERARQKREEERKARKAAREKRIADGMARRLVEERKSTMVKVGEIFKHGLQKVGMYRKDIQIIGGLAQEAVVGMLVVFPHPMNKYVRLTYLIDDCITTQKSLKTVKQQNFILYYPLLYSFRIRSMLDPGRPTTSPASISTNGHHPRRHHRGSRVAYNDG